MNFIFTMTTSLSLSFKSKVHMILLLQLCVASQKEQFEFGNRKKAISVKVREVVEKG